jgi:hypothetical protein
MTTTDWTAIATLSLPLYQRSPHLTDDSSADGHLIYTR